MNHHPNFALKKDMFVPYESLSPKGVSAVKDSLLISLSDFDESKNNINAVNGEVEFKCSMSGYSADVAQLLPADGLIEGVYEPEIAKGAVCDAAVEFALGRCAPVAGLDGDRFAPYSFFMKCDYDAADLLAGSGSRTDTVAAREIQKSFAAMAFPVIDSMTRVAVQRNLVNLPFWVVAAWRLRSGGYCFAGPPVLLVPDSGMPRLTIDSVKSANGGFNVSGQYIQRFCRMFCRITKADSLPDEVVGCDLFVTLKHTSAHDTETGEFGSLSINVFSHSGVMSDDGQLANVCPTPIDSSFERKRCWRPRVYDESFTMPLPDSFRLVARINRSEFRTFVSFSEPDYVDPGLGELTSVQNVKGAVFFTPDYQDRNPITEGSVARIGVRNILFNPRREYFKGFQLSQMASFRSSDSDVTVASRVLVGLHTHTGDCYIPLEKNIVVHSCDDFLVGTSCFYPSADAFELVVECAGVRHRFPLRSSGSMNGAARTCFDTSTAESVSYPLGAPVRSDRVIADGNQARLFLSDATWLSYYSGKLTFEIADDAKIVAAVPFAKVRNGFILLTDKGVWLLRLNADGSCTVLKAVDSASCTGGYLLSDGFLVYVTADGVRLYDGATVASLGDAAFFSGSNQLKATLLDSLPGAFGMLQQFCSSGESSGGAVNRLCYNEERGELVIINAKGDLFTVRLTEGKPVFAGNINGESAIGYLLTRPIKVDARASVESIKSVTALGLPDDAECVTALYSSRNLTHWQPVGAVSGSHLNVEGNAKGRFWRILFICRHAPDGFLMLKK